MSPCHIRQLVPTDWQGFKAIRLQALQLERAVYCASYEDMKDMPDDFWQERLVDNNFGYFGLYYDNELIGLSGVVRDPAKKHEAEFIASYIRKEHRGNGHSKLFYEARIDWAKANGITHIIISHRESNLASKKANQHFGFQFTHSVPRLWHDGKWEENVYYELFL